MHIYLDKALVIGRCQQWNRDAGRPIWPDAEILIQLMVWIGSSLWGSDQVFVHVESGWTTGRGMAERHNDVRAYDLKIHVGNLDGGTRTARRRGIIGPRSCHTRAGDCGRHSCHRDRPHCPSPQEHILVLPCSGPHWPTELKPPGPYSVTTRGMRRVAHDTTRCLH